MEEKRREEFKTKCRRGLQRECVMWLSKRTQMTENTLNTDIKDHYLVVLCVDMCVHINLFVCAGA